MEELARLMFEMDVRLEHGFSRELMVRALNCPEMTQKYGREVTIMNKEGKEIQSVEPILGKYIYPGTVRNHGGDARMDFLRNSGYQTKAK